MGRGVNGPSSNSPFDRQTPSTDKGRAQSIATNILLGQTEALRCPSQSKSAGVPPQQILLGDGGRRRPRPTTRRRRRKSVTANGSSFVSFGVRTHVKMQRCSQAVGTKQRSNPRVNFERGQQLPPQSRRNGRRSIEGWMRGSESFCGVVDLEIESTMHAIADRRKPQHTTRTPQGYFARFSPLIPAPKHTLTGVDLTPATHPRNGAALD